MGLKSFDRRRLKLILAPADATILSALRKSNQNVYLCRLMSGRQDLEFSFNECGLIHPLWEDKNTKYSRYYFWAPKCYLGLPLRVNTENNPLFSLCRMLSVTKVT